MTTRSKSALNQDLILAARQGLIPARERAWLGGFGNLLRKEMGKWWGTRVWWVQTLIWVLILNGVTTIGMLTEFGTPAEMLQEVVQAFLPMSAAVVGIGVVITLQGAIVGEKQLGTAAWVMSKPASRAAFILAKVVHYALGFGITAILIPTVIFVIMTRLLISAPLPLGAFLTGLALTVLSMLFYLALTLMLGTIFSSRGPIAGIGVAFIMAGLLLRGFIPLQVTMFTPWLLPNIAGALALDLPLPSSWFVPIIATSAWTLLMFAVALLRFGREEF
jgi:ABC-2 type transport system permease protein